MLIGSYIKVLYFVCRISNVSYQRKFIFRNYKNELFLQWIKTYYFGCMMVALKTLSLKIIRKGKSEGNNVSISQAVIAGWTGRDLGKVKEHIKELQKLGIKPPTMMPLFYRVGVSRLTIADKIEVTGTDSSGEAEFVILQIKDELFVGVGSDHTDRKVESFGITASKQLCDKPLSRNIWSFDEVVGHWDNLILRSWIIRNNDRQLYQEGSLDNISRPEQLLERFVNSGGVLLGGTVMFGGTVPAIGGIQPAERFEFELEDPILNRRLEHAYDISTLPIVE